MKINKKQTRKQLVINLVKIIISTALIVWLLHRIGIQTIVRQLATADPMFILAGVLTFAVSNIIGSIQWFLILRARDVKLSVWQAISYYHVGLFFNNFLIGYVGGDAFRIYDVNRSSGDFTSAMSTVILDRFVGFFSLTSLAMIVSLFTIRDFTSLSAIYIIGAVLFAWILALVILFNERVAMGLGRFFRPFFPKFVREKSSAVYYALNEFRGFKRSLRNVFILSFTVQALRILVHYWAALSVGVSTSVWMFFVFVPIIALMASLPISVGGIGVREQSGVTLFSSLGIAAPQVVAFEFLAYLIGIIATLPGGFLFAFRRERLSQHKEAEL